MLYIKICVWWSCQQNLPWFSIPTTTCPSAAGICGYFPLQPAASKFGAEPFCGASLGGSSHTWQTSCGKSLSAFFLTGTQSRTYGRAGFHWLTCFCLWCGTILQNANLWRNVVSFSIFPFVCSIRKNNSKNPTYQKFLCTEGTHAIGSKRVGVLP